MNHFKLPSAATIIGLIVLSVTFIGQRVLVKRNFPEKPMQIVLDRNVPLVSLIAGDDETIGKLRKGSSDISHHKTVRSRCTEDLSHQRCGGCFSVGSGDGCDPASVKVVGQFDLTPDGNTCITHAVYKGSIQCDPGTDHHQIRCLHRLN